jgi:hypothetical protein
LTLAPRISKADYVKTYLPLAQAVQEACGIPVLFSLAQSAYESAWGTSDVAKTDNNFFGIMPGGIYGKYPTPEAGWQAYSALINTSRYSGIRLVCGQGPRAIASFLCARGYNTVNPGYVGAISQIAVELAPLLSPFGT